MCPSRASVSDAAASLLYTVLVFFLQMSMVSGRSIARGFRTCLKMASNVERTPNCNKTTGPVNGAVNCSGVPLNRSVRYLQYGKKV